MKDANCLYCRKEFKTKRSSRKYCSAMCRQYAYLNRKGFELIHSRNNDSADLVGIEEEGNKLYDEMYEKNTSEVIVNDSKKVIDNNNMEITFIRDKINSINKEILGINDENDAVNDDKKRIINENQIREDNNIAVDDNKIITVIDEQKGIVNHSKENTALTRKLIYEKSEWIAYKNSFLKDLDDLYQRDYMGMPFNKKYYQWWSSDDWAYVSMCNSALYYFLHKLLYFDRSIEPVSLRELRELHEDIYYEQQSYCYRSLPEEYAYFNFFMELEKSISQWIDYCLGKQNQKISFKIHPAFKLRIYCILRQMKPEPDQDYYTLSTYDKEG